MSQKPLCVVMFDQSLTYTLKLCKIQSNQDVGAPPSQTGNCSTTMGNTVVSHQEDTEQRSVLRPNHFLETCIDLKLDVNH